VPVRVDGGSGGIRAASKGAGMSEDDSRPTSAEEVAAFEAEPVGDDVGPAAEEEAADRSLPDQAPGGPSRGDEDPAVVGPD
jgi:hypothetical protein